MTETQVQTAGPSCVLSFIMWCHYSFSQSNIQILLCVSIVKTIVVYPLFSFNDLNRMISLCTSTGHLINIYRQYVDIFQLQWQLINKNPLNKKFLITRSNFQSQVQIVHRALNGFLITRSFTVSFVLKSCFCIMTFLQTTSKKSSSKPRSIGVLGAGGLPNLHHRVATPPNRSHSATIPQQKQSNNQFLSFFADYV